MYDQRVVSSHLRVGVVGEHSVRTRLFLWCRRERNTVGGGSKGRRSKQRKKKPRKNQGMSALYFKGRITRQTVKVTKRSCCCSHCKAQLLLLLPLQNAPCSHTASWLNTVSLFGALRYLTKDLTAFWVTYMTGSSSVF